jgi:ABC-type taurine transport system ATPase subunit
MTYHIWLLSLQHLGRKSLLIITHQIVLSMLIMTNMYARSSMDGWMIGVWGQEFALLSLHAEPQIG